MLRYGPANIDTSLLWLICDRSSPSSIISDSNDLSFTGVSDLSWPPAAPPTAPPTAPEDPEAAAPPDVHTWKMLIREQRSSEL